MSSGDFFGPALPPGFQVSSGRTDEEVAEKINDTEKSSHKLVKRRHSSSKHSNSSSCQSSSESDLSYDESTRDVKRKQCDSNSHSTESQCSIFMGPALPPGFVSGNSSRDVGGFIGPLIPSSNSSPTKLDIQDEGDEIVGPLPCSTGDGLLLSQSVVDEIEARSQQMKDKLLGKELPNETETVTTREQWMTELPPEMGKNFGITARKFSTKVHLSTDKDRSIWTDTPADRARKEQALLTGQSEPEPTKACTSDADEFVLATDSSYRQQVDEYNKLVRPKSLLEIHSDKLHHKSRKSHHSKKKKKEKSKKHSKEKKKKKKRKSSSSSSSSSETSDEEEHKNKKRKKKEEEKVERRPFDREKDLQITRLDDAQRKSVIKHSQELTGRFGHGSLQFL